MISRLKASFLDSEVLPVTTCNANETRALTKLYENKIKTINIHKSEIQKRSGIKDNKAKHDGASHLMDRLKIQGVPLYNCGSQQNKEDLREDCHPVAPIRLLYDTTKRDKKGLKLH